MGPAIGDLLRYPLRGDDALRRHAIGGGIPAVLAVMGMFAFVVLFFVTFLIPLGTVLLFLGSYVVVPLVYLAVYWYWAGYFVRVARDTYAGGTRPPAFEDWGQLLKDGGFAVLIGVVYALPIVGLCVGLVAAVIGLGGGLSALLADVDGGGGLVTGAVLLAAMLGSLLVLAISMLAAYCYPISLCGYAERRSLRDAFDRTRLRAVATRTDYAGPWLLVTVASVGAYGLVWMLSWVFVGYLLVPLLPLLYFYLGVAGVYGFAAAYDEATVESA